MESDSVYIPRQDNLDLIDLEWAQDSLSDDEIELAPEDGLPLDEHELEATHPAQKDEEEEKWTDLGLEGFVSGTG